MQCKAWWRESSAETEMSEKFREKGRGIYLPAAE